MWLAKPKSGASSTYLQVQVGQKIKEYTVVMRPVTTNIICVPLVPFERFSVILPTTESHSLINLHSIFSIS